MIANNCFIPFNRYNHTCLRTKLNSKKRSAIMRKLKPSFQNLVNENRHKILEDKKVMEKIEEKIEARQEQAIKMKTK